ncbi:2-hydroxy-acid oxidase [Phytohabitans kaempferiae]|uniref:2-hydroxy-acid oxidase n=1 Tax=Phytohabitans kaempferiae TaxID=1620943 RepID=A0ABV6M7V7_9ACTN
MLWLARAARRVFDEPAARTAHPGHEPHYAGYLADLVGPYGLTPRPPAGGQSYGEMAAALIADIVRPDEPVDLLVLAFAVPDVRPGRATATYLSHVCPGGPLAFAVCDQGVAAGFTALQIAQSYPDLRRALVIVVEQATLHYDLPAPAPLPARHAGVALLCGDSGVARVGPVRCARNGALPAGTLDPPAGQPYTGVWWALAGELADPAPRRVVVADRDPVLGYTCSSTVDFIGLERDGGGGGVRVGLGAA